MALRRADIDAVATAMKALTDIKNTRPDRPVSKPVLTRLAGLPTLLRVSGVLPTLAFYSAKGHGDGELERAYAIVGAALRAQTCAVLEWDTGQAEQAIDLAFLDRLTTHIQENPQSLTRVGQRLQEFSVWLRRLAEALDGEQKRQAESKKSDPQEPENSAEASDG
jgi:CRISPR type III-B/RAMP module-associated protein Cmr5